MSDIAERLLERIEAKEAKAKRAGLGEWFLAADDVVEMHCSNLTRVGVTEYDIPVADTDGADEFATFIVDNQPSDVLRRCAADREIVAEVMSWPHFYLDGDTWFSCGLAVDPTLPDEEPGDGCANDDRGRCTCNLEGRQLKVLSPLARGYGLEV